MSKTRPISKGGKPPRHEQAGVSWQKVGIMTAGYANYQDSMLLTHVAAARLCKHHFAMQLQRKALSPHRSRSHEQQ